MACFITIPTELQAIFGEHCPKFIRVQKYRMPPEEKGTLALFDLDSGWISVNTDPVSPTRPFVPKIGREWEIELGSAIVHEIWHICQLASFGGNVRAMIETLFQGEYKDMPGEIEAHAKELLVPDEIKIYLAKKVR